MKATFTIDQSYVRLSATQPIQLVRLPIAEPVAPHDHEFYEICWVLKGSVVHRTAAGSMELKKGSMVIVPPGGVHAFDRPRNCFVINGYYLAEWLLSDLRSLWRQSEIVRLFLAAHLFPSRFHSGTRVLALREKFLPRMQAALREIETELARTQPSLLYLRAAFVKLLLEISRESDADASPDGGAGMRSELQLVLEEIEACLAGRNAFSAREASRKAGLSPEHLTKLFRERFGLSVRDYFQRRRVQLACARLLDPERALGEIAFDLGFSDHAHFHRSFQKVTGRTPRKYRTEYFLARQTRS
jgi:AraC-like DNA-binding protein